MIMNVITLSWMNGILIGMALTVYVAVCACLGAVLFEGLWCLIGWYNEKTSKHKF